MIIIQKKLMPRSASKYAAVPVLKKNKKSLKHHTVYVNNDLTKKEAFIVKLLHIKEENMKKKP